MHGCTTVWKCKQQSMCSGICPCNFVSQAQWLLENAQSVPQEKGINPQLVCDDHLLQSGALLGLLVHFFFIRHTKLHQFQVSRGSSQAWEWVGCIASVNNIFKSRGRTSLIILLRNNLPLVAGIFNKEAPHARGPVGNVSRCDSTEILQRFCHFGQNHFWCGCRRVGYGTNQHIANSCGGIIASISWQ